MPDGSRDSMSSPLATPFTERATLPYSELQELKAAAAAAASGNGFMVKALQTLQPFCYTWRFLGLFNFKVFKKILYFSFNVHV